MSVTILAIVLGAGLQAVAAPPAQSPSAANKAVKNGLPAITKPSTADKYKIERVGKMSSRPWTEIVGWRPGTSQFPDAENHQPQLVLVLMGF